MTSAFTLLPVRITCRQPRAGIAGWVRDRDGRDWLDVRLLSPEGERADAELVTLLAGSLALSERQVEVDTGGGARLKRVSLPISMDDVYMRLVP